MSIRADHDGLSSQISISTIMNIIQVNNYGYVRGGSDRYFLDVSDLLASNGHSVDYLVSTNVRNVVDTMSSVQGFDIVNPSFSDMAKYFYSRDARHKLRALTAWSHYDLAHLHIYYGQISPSILSVLKDRGIPVVQTLHEYKLLCPVASMTRDGVSCSLCGRGAFWHAAWHRCNRGSLSRSVVSSAESYFSRWLGAVEKIDHFIAVSDFVREQMIKYGVQENKITTVHNFVRKDVYAENHEEGRYFLYFGRLEEIKGVGTLIRAMRQLPDVELLIVGDGGGRRLFENQVSNEGLKNVKFFGFMSGQALRDLIAGAIAVVAPSEWNETFGLVLVESFAQCRPVIASRMGGMTEVVSDGIDGLLFDAGNVDQLVSTLEWMATHRQKAVEMGKAGQEKVKAKFSSEVHYENLMSVYKKIVHAQSARG